MGENRLDGVARGQAAAATVQVHTDNDDLRIFLGIVIIFGRNERDVADFSNLHAAEIDFAADAETCHRVIVVRLADEFILAVSYAAEINERAEDGDRPEHERKADLRIVGVIVVSHGLLLY